MSCDILKWAIIFDRHDYHISPTVQYFQFNHILKSNYIKLCKSQSFGGRRPGRTPLSYFDAGRLWKLLTATGADHPF